MLFVLHLLLHLPHHFVALILVALILVVCLAEQQRHLLHKHLVQHIHAMIPLMSPLMKVLAAQPMFALSCLPSIATEHTSMHRSKKTHCCHIFSTFRLCLSLRGSNFLARCIPCFLHPQFLIYLFLHSPCNALVSRASLVCSMSSTNVEPIPDIGCSASQAWHFSFLISPALLSTRQFHFHNPSRSVAFLWLTPSFPFPFPCHEQL